MSVFDLGLLKFRKQQDSTFVHNQALVHFCWKSKHNKVNVCVSTSNRLLDFFQKLFNRMTILWLTKGFSYPKWLHKKKFITHSQQITNPEKYRIFSKFSRNELKNKIIHGGKKISNKLLSFASGSPVTVKLFKSTRLDTNKSFAKWNISFNSSSYFLSVSNKASSLIIFCYSYFFVKACNILCTSDLYNWNSGKLALSLPHNFKVKYS